MANENVLRPARNLSTGIFLTRLPAAATAVSRRSVSMPSCRLMMISVDPMIRFFPDMAYLSALEA